MYSSVVKCSYNNFSDPKMLRFVNNFFLIVTIPGYNEHFGSFPEN